jgi:hypothetical protein
LLESPDDVDEVALRVLLAEGVDLPTAIEASRLNGESPQDRGCLGVAAMVVVAGALVYALF